nr:hypothetical protein [Tanacetum cinerariifolium]
MTTKAQQIELDNALVAPENRHVIGKCNMRINPGMKPKEPTYQVALDAIDLTTCYPAFLITTEVPVIYMHQFWAIVTKYKSSYRFKIDNKKFSVNVKVFRDILNICPKIQGQEFDEPSTEEEALSFIHELGHSGEIKHGDTQVYGAILPKAMTNQGLLDSVAYKTYYAITLGAEPPIGKGLNVLSEVSLFEAAQLKEATKRSKKDFHISQASGSGDGTEFESRVPDEQHLKTTGADEGTGTILGVPDVPKYDSKSEKGSWGDSGEEDKGDENDSEDKSDVGDDDDDGNDGNDDDDDEANDDDNQDEEEKINDEETIDDEVTKELYKDVNKADEPVQSSFVSFDFTSKLLNPKNPSPADNDIASLMETSVCHATTVLKITSVFTTTILPPPLFFNPLLQQATPTPTPTTSEATTLFPLLLDLSSVFKFNDKVTNLEKDLSEINLVDQYAQALSFIPAIVDRYIDNKLREAIQKSIVAYNLDCKEEAQAEKREYIELVDTSMRTILKEEVNIQLP